MAATAHAQPYIFYLHGKIVEDQGAKAVSPDLGPYEYDNILNAFRKEKFIVFSEVRKPNTDVKEYARRVAGQVDSLLKKGAKPADITVVGASKGAVIAMYVSTFLNNKDVNFVFMSACNDYNFEATDINFSGNILSIYEKSDGIGKSCEQFRQRSKASVHHYKEVALNTGLKHGYFYQPRPEWMNPVVQWANRRYE
jgi:hypothetical protein